MKLLKLFLSLALSLTLCFSLTSIHRPQTAWASEDGITENPALLTHGDFEKNPEVTLELQANIPSVSYRAHVANIGWQEWVADKAMAGTTGQALAMEGLTIRLLNNDVGGSIKYRANVAGTGLQGWVTNGALAGTTGQSRQMEAIYIELEGDIANEYSVYYRAHCANLGWLGWAKDGEPAGTSGYSYSLQALEIVLVKKGQSGPTSTATAFVAAPMALSYRTHVASIGWQGWVSNGATTGTTGRALAIEGINITLINPDFSGTIQYRAYVTGSGWQNWVSNGALSGTTGRALQMEAVQIRLTGEMADKYHVYYRAHSSVYCWLQWTMDGETAGTTGISCALEALMVVLVPKEGGKPPAGTSSFPAHIPLEITVQAYVAKSGWLTPVQNRQTVGTTGRSLRMEAFTIKPDGLNFSGGFRYRAYANSTGWTAWVLDGETAGATDQDRQLEALCIELYGDMAKYFDVYYRAHISSYGWLGWVKNGEMAGTTECGIPLEAFQIAIVPKGASAPGSTSRAYWDATTQSELLTMNERAASMWSPTEWLLVIDSANCAVGVYRGSQWNWTNYFYFACSPGMQYSPTIKGIYSVGTRGYVFGYGFSCYWWTQIYGDYLFHSQPYYPDSNVILDATMGVPSSAGCVRLYIDNAKWIYDNIPSGTTVLSY